MRRHSTHKMAAQIVVAMIIVLTRTADLHGAFRLGCNRVLNSQCMSHRTRVATRWWSREKG